MVGHIPWRREAYRIALLSVGFLTLFAVVLMGQPTAVDRWLEAHVQGIPWGTFSFIPAAGSDVGGGVYGFYLAPAIAAVVLAVRREWKLLALVPAVFVLHFMLI